MYLCVVSEEVPLSWAGPVLRPVANSTTLYTFEPTPANSDEKQAVGPMNAATAHPEVAAVPTSSSFPSSSSSSQPAMSSDSSSTKAQDAASAARSDSDSAGLENDFSKSRSILETECSNVERLAQPALPESKRVGGGQGEAGPESNGKTLINLEVPKLRLVGGNMYVKLVSCSRLGLLALPSLTTAEGGVQLEMTGCGSLRGLAVPKLLTVGDCLGLCVRIANCDLFADCMLPRLSSCPCADLSFTNCPAFVSLAVPTLSNTRLAFRECGALQCLSWPDSPAGGQLTLELTSCGRIEELSPALWHRGAHTHGVRV
eukprot:g37357.t1